MFHRIPVILAILALFSASPAPAQEQASAVAPETSGSTSNIYTGTLNVNVTIKLVSTLPAHSALRCAATAGLQVSVTQTLLGQQVPLGNLTEPGSTESVDAVISEGNATCNFVIPYSWNLPNSLTSTTSPVQQTITLTGIAASVSVDAVQLSSQQEVVRTYRSATLVAQTKTPPAQDNATTTLAASAVL